MARLQILELPTEHHGDDMVTPFVLVIDKVPSDETKFDAIRRDLLADGDLAPRLGARAVLVFEETIDIPANDATAYLGSSTSPQAEIELDDWEARNAIAADVQKMCDANDGGLKARDKDQELRAASEWIERLNAELDEARRWARHGYEIGQKHCGWSDHGVAPAWLTDGWPPHIKSCEHLKQMAEFDEALTRVRAVSTEPEVMNAQQEHPSVWKHGYHCGVLAAKGAARPRNEPTTKPADA